MEADNLLMDKLAQLDLKKTGVQAIKFVGGIFLAYISVSLLGKFVNDNWDFRIKKISNRKASINALSQEESENIK